MTRKPVRVIKENSGERFEAECELLTDHDYMLTESKILVVDDKFVYTATFIDTMK